MGADNPGNGGKLRGKSKPGKVGADEGPVGPVGCQQVCFFKRGDRNDIWHPERGVTHKQVTGGKQIFK